MGQLPSRKADSFEDAGKTKTGPVRFRTVDWEYQPPRGQGGEQYRGTFDIFERPGQVGLNERVFDSFFLDGNSVWKLKALALGSGLSYPGGVDWAEVAQDCVGRECWGYLDEYKSPDGRAYPRFTKFAASLAELQSSATPGAAADKTAAGRF